MLLVKRLFLKSDLTVWDIKICAVFGENVEYEDAMHRASTRLDS